MQMGEVIRENRKKKNMTQEQVAVRLGVTAPAVNKWENGNSYPDITLLSPLARLLNISLNALLCHEQTLSDAEAMAMVEEMHQILKTESVDTAFLWMKRCLQEYPNSTFLQLNMARVFYGQLLMTEAEIIDAYQTFIVDCFERVLHEGAEAEKTAAAESLVQYYINCEEFAKAETYLIYFSHENPERKRKQAMIFEKTGRRAEALKSYEELLYTGYAGISMTLNNLIIMALQDKDLERAHMLVDKMEQVARVFEFGEYAQVSPGLELAILEQDEARTLYIVERMLGNLKSIVGSTKSQLYTHMQLKEVDKKFFDEVRQGLLEGFRDTTIYAYMQDNERWKALVNNAHAEEVKNE